MEANKTEYKLDSGLWCTRVKEFKNDQEAWDTLRLLLPNKYVTMFKLVTIELPILNRSTYIKKWNSKYTSQKIGKHNYRQYWQPIMEGITSHKYRKPK